MLKTYSVIKSVCILPDPLIFISKIDNFNILFLVGWNRSQLINFLMEYNINGKIILNTLESCGSNRDKVTLNSVLAVELELAPGLGPAPFSHGLEQSFPPKDSPTKQARCPGDLIGAIPTTHLLKNQLSEKPIVTLKYTFIPLPPY